MARRGTIGKKTDKGRSDQYHFRCSPDFKKLLEKVVEARKEDCEPIWSGADVIHVAVKELAKKWGIKDVPEKL